MHSLQQDAAGNSGKKKRSSDSGLDSHRTSASLLSHSSSRLVEVLDTSRRFLGASISEKNDKADNVGDTETNSRGLGKAEINALNDALWVNVWSSVQVNLY